MAKSKIAKQTTQSSGVIRIGVGGWTYEPWRGTFYPENLTQKDELKYLSHALTSIEINGTYYGSQKPATFAKWRDETPENFVFSVKAPRFVMNRTVLASAEGSIQKFVNSGVTELKEKLGPINWQFLPTKKFDPADFEAFLKLLPREAQGRPLRHAIEVRNDSFHSPVFVALARQYEVAIVIAGDSEHPLIADTTASFVYVRIMGTKPKQKTGYAGAALKTWASRVSDWSSGKDPKGLDYLTQERSAGKPRDVFLYVISGHKVVNPVAAQSLIKLLA